MVYTPKRNAMLTWLKANPGKTERNWLLEVRCQTNSQRDKLKALFNRIDESGFPDFRIVARGNFIEIHDTPANWPAFVESSAFTENNRRSVYVEFDFVFGGVCYDLDTPNSVYEADRYRMIREFFSWKAKQMGLQNTNFVYACREYYSSMRDGWKHWSKLLLPKSGSKQ